MSKFFEQNLFQLSDGSDSDAEFIPLITAEEEENMNKEVFPPDLPILSLRNNVLFPGVVIPITVGRDMSIKLVNDANKGDKIIGVVSKKIKRKKAQNLTTYIKLERLLKSFDCKNA